MFSLATALLFFAGCSDLGTFTVIYPEMIVTPDIIEYYDYERETVGIAVGESYAETVAIVNAGRAPLVIEDIYLLENNSAFSLVVPEVTELLSDEQLVVDIRFEPPNFLPYQDTLVIQTNDPDYEDGYTVALIGEGVDAPKPCIEVDPLSLDFGDVDANTTEILWFEITNCGETDLTVTGTELTGSSRFSVVSNEPSGSVISPGGNDLLTVNVLYDPQGDDFGHDAIYTVFSDDPDNPEAEVLLIGNGGGGAVYPEAVIDCPAEVAPLDRLALDGSGSFDPTGRPITEYFWSLEERPRGSRSEMAAEKASTSTLFLDSAGDYEVRLVVTNDIGVSSEPAVCAMDAIPKDAIHIELTWNTSDSDLDLHLANAIPETTGGNLFLEPEDVNFCYPQGQWGGFGEDDDAFLDLDDLVGYGPENINIFEPDNGEYLARVHFFGSASGDDTTATIRIYLRGELAAEYEKVMEKNDVWDVAVIDWPDKTSTKLETELYSAVNSNCYREAK